MRSLVRVALLDDHPLMRDALTRHLSEQGFEVVVSTGSPAALLPALATRRADLAILDLAFGGGELEPGLALLAQLRGAHPEMRLLVLTSASRGELARRCYDLGAAAFLSKVDATPQRLLEVVAGVTRGERLFPVELATDFAGRVRAELAGDDGPRVDRLTARERQVLGCVAAGHDNLKIGAMLEISERTVKAHVAAIYRKLAVENRVQLAIRARQLGIDPEGPVDRARLP